MSNVYNVIIVSDLLQGKLLIPPSCIHDKAGPSIDIVNAKLKKKMIDRVLKVSLAIGH
jgi:hypothetical protein